MNIYTALFFEITQSGLRNAHFLNSPELEIERITLASLLRPTRGWNGEQFHEKCIFIIIYLSYYIITFIRIFRLYICHLFYIME